MYVRPRLCGFLACLTLAVVGCSNPRGLDSVAVSPPSQSLAVTQTVQLTATGTFGNATHPSSQNITSSVTWSSTVPAVATVNGSGLVTAVNPGTATITASATAFNGPVSSSSVITVTGSATNVGGSSGGTGGSGSTGSSSGSNGNIVSLTIIPSGIVFGELTQSGQFLAIATYATAPTIRDVTNQVTWLTSQPNKFPISNNVASGMAGAGTQNGGVVTAYEASVGNVGATITAELPDSNGSLAIATASVGCPYKAPTATDPGTCNNPVFQLLSTLTVYNEGLNTTGWELTAPSATGTPSVIHCGPGFGSTSSVCTATYPLGTNVTITAPAINGVKFGGWSSNCTNTGTVTQTGPNTCTINLSASDATVGAIFN